MLFGVLLAVYNRSGQSSFTEGTRALTNAISAHSAFTTPSRVSLYKPRRQYRDRSSGFHAHLESDRSGAGALDTACIGADSHPIVRCFRTAFFHNTRRFITFLTGRSGKSVRR